MEDVDTRKRKRVNMRLPADLVDFIKEDASKRGTNMTNDYIQYLRAKKQAAEGSTDGQH